MKDSLRHVAIVCGNQIRRVLLERGTAIWLLALPIALIGILGISLQPLMSTEFMPHEPFKVVLTESPSGAHDVLLGALQGVGHLIEVTTVESSEIAEKQVLQREVDAALILAGSDLSDLTLRAKPGAVVTEILKSILTGVLSADAVARSGSVELVHLEVTGESATGNGFPGWLQADAFTYYAVGIATMFVMFATHTIGVMSGRDRKSDTFARLRTMGVRPFVYMLGGALASTLVGVLFLLVMAFVTSLLFGVEWGNPVMWTAISLAGAAAAAGLSLLVMALLPHPDHADGAGSAIFNVLAFLGGSMTPLQVLPEWFRTAFTWLPNRALLQGYLKVAEGADWSAVSEELLTLLWATVLLFSLGSALWMLRTKGEA